jgi:phosphotransferase system enzyme I (PtsI)
LQSISRTLKAAEGASIPAIVCGEMAASPAYSVVLAGLGARDFSMTASSIPRVRRTLAEIRYAEAAEIAALCLEGETADDVEEIVRGRLGTAWPHLFPPKSLPARKNKE